MRRAGVDRQVGMIPRAALLSRPASASSSARHEWLVSILCARAAGCPAANYRFDGWHWSVCGTASQARCDVRHTHSIAWLSQGTAHLHGISRLPGSPHRRPAGYPGFTKSGCQVGPGCLSSPGTRADAPSLCRSCSGPLSHAPVGGLLPALHRRCHGASSGVECPLVGGAPVYHRATMTAVEG